MVENFVKGNREAVSKWFVNDYCNLNFTPTDRSQNIKSLFQKFRCARNSVVGWELSQIVNWESD